MVRRATSNAGEHAETIKFSVNSKRLHHQSSLADITVAFFVDDYRGGFAKDKASPDWNDNPVEKKRLRNLFANIKRAVRLVLMHADSYPSASNPVDYKESLRRIATAAEERIRSDFEFGPNAVISVYKLAKHPKTKELEKTLSLPANTPDDICKFFKVES